MVHHSLEPVDASVTAWGLVWDQQLVSKTTLVKDREQYTVHKADEINVVVGPIVPLLVRLVPLHHKGSKWDGNKGTSVCMTPPGHCKITGLGWQLRDSQGLAECEKSARASCKHVHNCVHTPIPTAQMLRLCNRTGTRPE